MSDHSDLDELRQQVQQLREVETARNTAMAYASAIDASDPEATGAVFASEATLSIPSGDITGREAIVDFYRSRFIGVQRRHFLTNVRARPISPGLVHIDSYFLFVSRESETSALGWGTYRDVVDVAAERPVITHKTITPAHFTDLASGWPL